MPAMPKRRDGESSATHSSPNTSKTGSSGRGPDGSAWTSTRLISRTPWQRVVTPSLTPTHRSGDSGLTTELPAGASASQSSRPWHSLYHQRMDTRRLQGGPDRPRRPAAAPRRCSRCDLCRVDRSPAPSGRRRGQALWTGLRELRRRLTRVLLRLRRLAAQASVPGRWSLPSHRGHFRQDLGSAHVPGRDPAARQPGRAVG